MTSDDVIHCKPFPHRYVTKTFCGIHKHDYPKFSYVPKYVTCPTCRESWEFLEWVIRYQLDLNSCNG